MAQSPTVRRLQLGHRLRRLRERAQFSQEDAASELECDPSKVSKIELGKLNLAPAEIKNLLRLYGVDGDEAEQVRAIANEARQRSERRGPKHAQVALGLEAEAARIFDLSISLVPGLLQTQPYTEAVVRADDLTGDPAVAEELIKVRHDRQDRLLGDDPPQLWVVMGEEAIRRIVGGPKVMREQMGRLLELARLPTVSLRILPFSIGAHPAMGCSFTIFQVPDLPDIAYVEGLVTAEYYTEVAAYAEAHARLCTSARDEAGSMSLIEGAMGEL